MTLVKADLPAKEADDQSGLNLKNRNCNVVQWKIDIVSGTLTHL